MIQTVWFVTLGEGEMWKNVMTEVSRPRGRRKKVTETGIQSAYILEYSHHLWFRQHLIPDSHTPWYT